MSRRQFSYKYLPIRRKLILFSITIAFSAILISLSILYFYNINSFKQRLAEDLIIQAQIYGKMTEGVVSFGDKTAANELLHAVSSYENIEAVIIKRNKPSIFDSSLIAGTYIKNPLMNKNPDIPIEMEDGYKIGSKYIEVLVSNKFHGEDFSKVYIKSNLDPIREQTSNYLRVMAIVLVIAIIFSFVLTIALEKSISGPIFKLAQITRYISNSKNYSYRIQKREGDDEVSILFKGFNYMLEQIEEHNHNLMIALDNISEQKEEIISQKDRIEKQSKKLSVFNEELKTINKDITDSINYAKGIQDAILPPLADIHKMHQDTFVLFKPRDIVSGDFYWFNQTQGKILFAAVDCTGHGVPGALLSIVGSNLLDQIVTISGITNPAKILKELNNNVHHALHKDSEGIESRDGMDIGLVSVDIDNKKLEYAGAFNSLYIVRSKELLETKADRFSIGSFKGNQKSFTNHEIDLQENDIIYLFSDGYPDQFGGIKGKKLTYKKFKRKIIEVSELPVLKQQEELNDFIDTWKGDGFQVDDILVIGMKI